MTRTMKYLLTFFVSTFFFALTYKSATSEFLSIDLVLIGFLLVVVVSGECLIARIFARYRLIENYILAGFTIFNIFYLNLVMNQGFIALPRYYGQVPALLTGAFIVVTLFDMMDRSKRFSKTLPTLFALFSVGVVLWAVIPHGPTIATFVNKPGKTNADNVRLIPFARKPNVYFVSFDSLIPKVLLKKYIGLETTAYHDVLGANFRRFENFFADRIPSKPSLNSLLALDINHYDEAVKDGTAKEFFVGFKPSPLFELFKNNGYETTTFYRGYYFGKSKGPFVDNYQFTNQGNSRLAKWLKNTEGACEFINLDGIKALTFLGYCYLANSNMFTKILSLTEGDNQLNTLIRLMRDGLNKTTPQVFVAYLFSPGHTPNDFNENHKQELIEYRDYYQKQSKITASYLNNLIQFINDEDPTAILYVFGDHGPLVSRRADIKKDSMFAIQDKFGVYGGIFPKDRCKNSFSEQDKAGLMTVALGARLIIQCLAGGKDPFVNFEGYRLPTISEPGISRNYEDYLYE